MIKMTVFEIFWRLKIKRLIKYVKSESEISLKGSDKELNVAR